MIRIFDVRLLQYLYLYMKSSNQEARAIYVKERNHKISSILVLLITIFEKIERLKQKLCGFSPIQFSPQSIFEALDLTGKGYLDVYDIHCFLGNQRIRDKDILILFSRLGDQGQGRLTYLGYLALLKPFFNYDLARDLLLRDTITHRKNRDYQDQNSLHEMQETVLILLNQLILLHCISIAEHEDLKNSLIQEYMLNQIELKQILGLGGKIGAITALHEFIECNSEYEVSKDQVKYILALTQCSEPSLPQERYINILFIPSKSFQKKSKKQAEAKVKTNYQMETLHANYSKNYLGKADLFNTSNLLSFLNYIHPNSYHHPIHDTAIPKQKQMRKQEVYIGQQQHNKIQISQQKINRPFKLDKRPPQEQMTQSIVQKSNLHQIRKDSSRFQQVSYERIQTPVLQQFMHESNIKRNMGNYRGKQERLELKQLIEESELSESSAFVRQGHNSKGPIKYVPQAKKYYEPSVQEKPQYINKFSYNRPSSNSYEQNKSSLSNVNTSGILNQFLKSQFR